MKGGEKITSEWEKLEKLSKEELIIRLVRMETLYSMLRSEQDDTCVLPEQPVKDASTDPDDFNPGELTTDEWAERIALYGAMHPKDGVFYSCDLMDYGLTDQQAYDTCKRLYREGRLKLPDGIDLMEDFRCRDPIGPNLAGSPTMKRRASSFVRMRWRMQDTSHVPEPMVRTPFAHRET